MGARLRVFLTAEQDRTLFEIRTATTVPQRVKDRAQALRMSSQGWYVERIAAHLKWNVDSVRETIHRWHRQGLGGLWDAPRPGGKPRWQAADMEHLEQILRDEPRTYNSQQLARRLAADRQVSLSADRVRRILKKRGCDGSGRGRAIAPSKIRNNEPANKPTSTC